MAFGIAIPYAFIQSSLFPKNTNSDNWILVFRSVLATDMLSSGQSAKPSSPWFLFPWLIQEAEKSSGSMKFPMVTAGLGQEWGLQEPHLEYTELHLSLLSSVPSLG